MVSGSHLPRSAGTLKEGDVVKILETFSRELIMMWLRSFW
jgi:hypothetical protein